MSDSQKGLLVIAAFFTLGVILGALSGRAALESNMLESGAAYYDAKTGDLVYRQFKGE